MKTEFFKNFQFGQKITSKALTSLYETFVDKENLWMDHYGINEKTQEIKYWNYFVTVWSEFNTGNIRHRVSFVFAESIWGIDIMECIYIK